jgi:hypothetical protein
MTRALRVSVLAVLLAAPALAAEEPADMAGFWGVGPTPDDQVCDLELLPAIAYEFEGVWHVARPLHYEDNRAACRALGIDDIVAWSRPEAGDLIWLLADGEAALMEFAPGADSRWIIARSGHADLPRLVLEKHPDPPAE